MSRHPGIFSRPRAMGRAVFLTLAFAALAAADDDTFKEWHEDIGREKIKKTITVDIGPNTHNSFSDGHGVAPYLTSKEQLPKKIGLITFYVYDNSQVKSVHSVSTTRTWVTAEGGNLFANKFLQASIGDMKRAFEAQGIQLLTIGELLDTDEKKNHYHKGVSMEVSRMGKVLTALESGGAETFASASGYRLFDAAATSDYMRARSLGHDLARALGADAVLSVGLEVGTDGKIFTLNAVKWAVNGLNPNPRQDKKYVAESFGNGYNEGQCYLKSQFYLKDPVVFYNAKKKSENYEGFGLLMEAFVEKTGEVWAAAIDKAAK